VAAASGFLALPIVLRELGTTDFGIFSVIAGSLSILLFLNVALTGGAQRHIAYALGENSNEEASGWFCASLMIHGILALALLAVALSCSHWVVGRLLSLPSARLGAALWIYRAVILVLCCSILSTPYQALLFAKEAIVALSLMAMASSVVLLIGVYFLKFLAGDHLLWYSGVYAVSDGLLMTGPVFYCVASYSECRQMLVKTVTWRKIRRLIGFSSWNIVGTLSVQIRYQGPAILFNRFVGTSANAAYGIATQVNGFAANVSTALLSATSPTIVKAEARGDRTEALFISNLSNKYGFLLLWLLVGPVLFSLRFVLTLWLHQMPEETVVFSAALLVALLLDMLSAGFVAAVQAEGRIAAYQAVVGFLLCVSVPVGYLLLRFHLPASSVLWATAASSVLANAGRVWFLCKQIGLSARDWATGVLRPCVVICAACCVAMGTIVMSVKPGFLHLASLYLVNSGIAAVLCWGFASSDAERTLRQAYVLRLQEAVLGNRRALVFAPRKQ
jgi:O-antigen/teichoic acid export membrane protein